MLKNNWEMYGSTQLKIVALVHASKLGIVGDNTNDGRKQ
jgi:hypothetical protein